MSSSPLATFARKGASCSPSTPSAPRSTARRSPRRATATATNRRPAPPSSADVAVNYCRQTPLKPHQPQLVGLQVHAGNDGWQTADSPLTRQPVTHRQAQPIAYAETRKIVAVLATPSSF